MTNQNNEIKAEILATLKEAIAEIDANTNNDFILCYPSYGIGIRFAGEAGAPVTTTLARAETIVPEVNDMPEDAWARTPIVKNGSGEQAQIMQRKHAMKIHREKLIVSLEGLNKIMAA